MRLVRTPKITNEPEEKEHKALQRYVDHKRRLMNVSKIQDETKEWKIQTARQESFKNQQRIQINLDAIR
jgi:hypothetical protein